MESPDIPGESDTEALSEGTPGDSPVQRRISPESYDEADTWLPLRAASEKAGVSVSALRKWYRAGKIQSRLEPGPTGDMRMVLLSEVTAGAGQRQAPKPTATVTEEPPAASWSDDVLPIPKDAWNKMIEQLGNLHEAGQRLAEEAAGRARAETEAAFLRERITDLLAQLEETRRPPVSPLQFVESHGGETPLTDPSPGIQVDRATMETIVDAAREAADAKPPASKPDELVEQTITEEVEGAAARRPWWVRTIRRGRA